MQESSNESKKDQAGVADSDATSKETLSDVEEKEADSGDSSKLEPAPSPDGAFDESDEKKDAGPM